jgi:hypothetical protein
LADLIVSLLPGALRKYQRLAWAAVTGRIAQYINSP